MYRLLMSRGISAHVTSNFSSNVNLYPSKVICACGNYICKPKAPTVTAAPNCNQNTHTNVAILNALKKKRKIKKSKKYTELIEVTGNSSCEKRAAVSKLKAKDLNRLVHPTEAASIIPINKRKQVPLEQMPLSSEEVLETKNDEEGIALLNELAGEDVDAEQSQIMEYTQLLEDPIERIHDETATDTPSKSDVYLPVDSATKKSDLKSDKKKIKGVAFSPNKWKLMMKNNASKTKDTLMKSSNQSESVKPRSRNMDEKSFEENFLSYLDACVYNGLLNRAMSALSYVRLRGRRDNLRNLDLKFYEVLLQAFAGKMNLSKVDDLMKMIREDNSTPTPDCYAAIFECIGRKLRRIAEQGDVDFKFSKESKIQLLRRLKAVHNEMQEKGVSLNDLFAKTSLLSDRKEMVMDAVLQLDPDFTPVWPPCPDFGYSCRLLQSLNENEEENTYLSTVSGILNSEQLKQFTQEQLETELKDCLEVKSIEVRDEPKENNLLYLERLKETQEQWRNVIRSALERDIQSLLHRNQLGSRSINLYPFLISLSKDELVELVLQEIRKLAEGSETFSPTTGQLYRELGARVLERYQVRWKEKNGVLDKVKYLYEKYCEWFSNPDQNKLASQPITCTRQAWQALVYSHQKEGASLNFQEKNWPVNIQMGIGKFLYEIILREIRIDVNISRAGSKKSHLLPAFYTLFRSQQHGKILKEEVKPHPALARLFRAAAGNTLQFPARCVPMLCPPTPWTTVQSGGYLLTKVEVIRLPIQAKLQWNRLVNCPTQQIYPALDSLNQLGAVPWKVNQSVLDVVIEVFNSGGSSQLSIPPPPSSFVPTHSSVIETEGLSEENIAELKAEAQRQNRERLYLRRKRAEAYSLWCDMLYRLSLANHFRDRIFWLPHNMDFRGRVYPCPPHLNHLGSDVARSLLCFARGKPLGPNGLNWLKLHLVNLTGKMKHNPISERMVFAEEIMPEILDSAEKPLTGRMWWSKSEEPWQTLAACIEIKNALAAEGGPENYICHFPVHQDGSCNGLQHYAALGRDAAGAASVSMAPSECPQDVYGVVASMVERERAADEELGIEVAQVLKGFVRRKVIKQTVMTTVYGVTRFGARLQIARQLRDIEEFPKEHVWRASAYLVGKTFGCLREMFTSTKEIQDWFTECARLISQVRGHSVEWVTPLGLPVVQPYNKIIGPKRHGTADPLSAGYYKFATGLSNKNERPNVMKQKNAFPPNFIHSIDSSHMMLTSLFCERKGLTFVSVHDCYWTHPSTVEIMNQVCREQFVLLHSEPILEDLSAFLVENYGYSESELGETEDSAKRKLNEVLRQVPKKGDFDLRSVLDSVYFFS